jgi:hypothetical protein
MRRNIKAQWYSFISNPFQVTMILGFIVFMIIYGSTGSLCCLFFLLLYLVPFVVLERTIPKGFPKLLAVPLTSMFYGIRAPSGRVTIFEKRPSGKYDCRDLIRLILAQQSLLPSELAMKHGKYRAITHENVLKRIRELPGVKIESTSPVYMADISANLKYLTKGACKHCKKKCPAAIGRKTKRQYYDVKFTIAETRGQNENLS